MIWKDKVSNEKIRQRTGLGKLEDMLIKRRLRWFGHVHRMDDKRITKQALKWTPADGKKEERQTEEKLEDDRNGGPAEN